jgi:hypothetical protein
MHRTIALLITVSILSVAVVSGGAASESFGLSVAGSIETPDRTVNHDELGEHTFSAVGVTTPGDPLSVSVTAPSEGTHFLDLYKGRDRVDTLRIENGSETVSIQTDGLDPGSYFLRLLSDGNTEVVYPVVIEGYDINVEQTENTSTDELEVSTTVTPTASTGAPESVEAVVWNDETEKRETLRSESGDSYAGTVSLSAFGDSSYHVYVAAVGEKTVNDRNEILAIGEGESETGGDGSADDGTGGGSTDDGTGGGSANDGAGGGSTDDGTTDETATDQPVDDGTDNGTADESLNDSIGENATNDSEISDETTNEEPSNDDSVIEPTDSDTTAADDSATNDTTQMDDETPLSPVVAIGALVATALLAARRSR